MVDRVKGVVVDKYPDSLSLSVGPVALRVFVPTSLLGSLSVGDSVELFTELLLPQEGPMALYGFSTKEERELFRKLTKVPKVGSKLALSILSHFSPEELKAAVESGDVEALSAVPGLGKKLSQRLILELKGKLKEPSQVPSELLELLLSLGYKKREVEKALKGLSFQGLSPEEALKLALKRLSGEILDRET